MQCRVVPIEIAKEIGQMYSTMRLKCAAQVDVHLLDPDAYFLADFGPCKIRSAQAIQGQFAQKLAAATDGSDNESDLSSDEMSSGDEAEAQDTIVEVGK